METRVTALNRSPIFLFLAISRLDFTLRSTCALRGERVGLVGGAGVHPTHIPYLPTTLSIPIQFFPTSRFFILLACCLLVVVACCLLKWGVVSTTQYQQHAAGPADGGDGWGTKLVSVTPTPPTRLEMLLILWAHS